MKTKFQRLSLSLTAVAGGAAWAQTPPTEAPKPEAVQARAATLVGNGEYGRALPLLERMVKDKPSDNENRYLLALAYQRAARYPQALETYAPLLKDTKKYPGVAFAIADIHYTLQNFPAAHEYFDRSEKLGYRADQCRYMRAFMDMQAGRPGLAEPRFRAVIASPSAGKDLKQGSALYLALITLAKEKPAKVDGPAAKQLEAVVAMNPTSESGRLAQAKLGELRGPPAAQVASRWSGSASFDVEFDTNVLNENDNTTNPTGAKAFKFAPTAEVGYQATNRPSFTFRPALSLTSQFFKATDSANQAAVDATSNVVVTPIFAMSTMTGRYEVSYPVRTAVTYNDSDADGTWSFFSLGTTVGPSVRWKQFGENYTSISTDYTYTKNTTDSLSTQSFRMTGGQTWGFVPGKWDSSFNANIGRTWMSTPNWAGGANASLTYTGAGNIGYTSALNWTLTHYTEDPARGNENLVSFDLSANRVFKGNWALNLHYTYERLFSGLDSAVYGKSKIGLRGTYSF